MRALLLVVGVLVVWTAIALPVAIFIGRFIKAGRRHWPDQPPDDHPD